MKNIPFLLLFISCLNITIAHSQVKTKTLKKVAAILKMPKTAEDEMPGKRGACVVWHPLQKKYYASMAGNMNFPFAVFDMTGKKLSGNDDVALIDVRGLWYNTEKRRIEGNGYNDNGWFFYKLNAKGTLSDVEVLFEGMNQPDEQSVGAYNAKDKTILFLNGTRIMSYSLSDAVETGDELMLHLGLTEKDGASEEEDLLEDTEGYNTTTVIYTGIPHAEIGVLNTDKLQVELYDIKNGFMTQVFKLPDSAKAEGTFNFAYANGIIWLFDMEGRTWHGFK